MDLVLICLRNWLWRALGSDGQICNGFGIDLLKKLTLERLGSDGQIICNGFGIDLLKKLTPESPGIWICKGQQACKTFFPVRARGQKH